MNTAPHLITFFKSYTENSRHGCFQWWNLPNIQGRNNANLTKLCRIKALGQRDPAGPALPRWLHPSGAQPALGEPGAWTRVLLGRLCTDWMRTIPGHIQAAQTRVCAVTSVTGGRRASFCGGERVGWVSGQLLWHGGLSGHLGSTPHLSDEVGVPLRFWPSFLLTHLRGGLRPRGATAARGGEFLAPGFARPSPGCRRCLRTEPAKSPSRPLRLCHFAF